MSTDLKQELDEDLSRLIRVYEKRGLDPESIADSFDWHSTLALSRARDDESPEQLLEYSD